MASLLDKENLDKMFGITPSAVPSSLLGDNFDQQANVATALGFAAPLIQKGITPESILEGYIKGGMGRQGIVDKKTKNYMTQQDILTQTLKANKLNQDIMLNKYAISDAPLKSSKLYYETGESLNKFEASNLRMAALRDKMEEFENNKNYKELNYIRLNPDKWLENEFKNDIATDYKKRPLPDAWLPAIRSIGLDPAEKGTWTPSDWIDVDNLISAAKPEVANERNLAAVQANVADRKVPYIPTLSINDVRNNILNRKYNERNNGVTPNLQKDSSPNVKNIISRNNSLAKNKDGTINLRYYKPSREEVGLGEIPAGVDERFPEGVVFASNNRNYTITEWDGLGSEFQAAYDPRLNATDSIKTERQVTKNAKSEGKESEYLFKQIDKTNRVIEEILSKPDFLEDLQSIGGKALVNMNLGKYGFTSNVQDVKNLLDLTKNQQFINQIQDMRRSNDTGGAVGNVSNFEVNMFMNAAAALQEGGSAEFIYNQLSNLYNEGSRVMKNADEVYRNYYGDKYAQLSGMNQYDYKRFTQKPSYKDALEAKGITDFKERKVQKNLTEVDRIKREEIQNIINTTN